MRPISLKLRAWACLLFAFIYAPIAMVVAYSFNAARYGGQWTGFTTHWYSALWQNSQALSATRHSLELGVCSTALSTCLGTLLAFGLGRYRFPGKVWVMRVLYVPVFIPDIILAIALLLLFSLVHGWIGWPTLGMATMVLGHVTFQIPFVAIVVRARLSGMDPALEEAARDLGATSWQTWRHVTLPAIAPGVAAGALLAFTLSLDDFVVSFFTSGPGSTTLPILIYSSVKRGVTPDINALSSLLILASAAGAVAIGLLQKFRNTVN